jgi:hypothetical protein
MDRMSQGAAAVLGRWRLFATVIPTAAVVVLGAGAALAASHASLSLKGKTIVAYTKSDALTGTLSSGKKGALVELQRRVWPFKGSYKTVAKTHTGAGGVYKFKSRPSLATQYRALAPRAHAKSRTRTVYVVKSFRVLKCVLRNSRSTYPGCGTTTAPPGKYTWQLTIEFIYPKSVFGQEKGKAVYTYYGQRVGSRKPPRTLTRQKTAHQRPYTATTTFFKFAKRIVVPHSAYEYEGNFCTKTTERTDGFGLPGAPGSHMCGKANIPGKTSVYKLG